jgi:hypothetical protein
MPRLDGDELYAKNAKIKWSLNYPETAAWRLACGQTSGRLVVS